MNNKTLTIERLEGREIATYYGKPPKTDPEKRISVVSDDDLPETWGKTLTHSLTVAVRRHFKQGRTFNA